MSGETATAGERPRQQAELEAERDFLLRSLDDLDAEQAAGDIDDADYRALKDDYTARAAGVLRRLQGLDEPPADGAGDGEAGAEEEGDDQPGAAAARAKRPAPAATAGGRRRPRWPLALSIVATLAVAIGSGYLVTRTSGERLPGQESSGGPTQSNATLLQQAINLDDKSQVVDAAKLYDAVLVKEPQNVLALTRRGWLLGRSGRQAGNPQLLQAALGYLDKATKIDPSFGDAHAFRGLVLGALARPGEAACEFRSWLAIAPVDDGQRPSVEAVLDEAVKQAGPNLPACPKPPLPEPVPVPAGPTPAPAGPPTP